MNPALVEDAVVAEASASSRRRDHEKEDHQIEEEEEEDHQNARHYFDWCRPHPEIEARIRRLETGRHADHSVDSSKST